MKILKTKISLTAKLTGLVSSSSFWYNHRHHNHEENINVLILVEYIAHTQSVTPIICKHI